MHRACRISRPSLSLRANYHSPGPYIPQAFLGLSYKKNMADPETAQAGQIRTRPDPELGLRWKKPRLDTDTFPDKAPGTSEKKVSKRAKKKKRGIDPEPYSGDDVLWRDVISLLGKDTVDKALEEGTEMESPFEFHDEVELEVSSLCSSGEGLALAPEPRRPWAVVVPFCLPGEKIRARIYRNVRLHSLADLIEVITPNPELRDSSRVQCKHFGSCAGCQYQMLSYDTQLDLKRDVVVKAYQNFSDLPGSSIPPIGSTIASPLQYGYRTKITPHFEAPPRGAQKKAALQTAEAKPDWLKIGFNRIGTRNVMDIEECPIATPVLTEALNPIRENIIKNIYTYKRGVSLLLRDSLEASTPVDPPSTDSDPMESLSSSLEKHVCITDHKATVREKVGDMLFEYPAGSFFQNNNSVLVPLTDYVHEAIFPPSINTAERPTHLVDAYCGAGLFAITLSPYFSTITGIELSSDSIKFATRNARLNKIPEGKCTFRAGDAANIFATVGDFPPDRTVLIIDPPRKGCDDNFIQQLLTFRCRAVVYVSCNVHTQARDVGVILKRTENEETGRKYVLESLRGFDLFPQTAHVESVAVLRLA